MQAFVVPTAQLKIESDTPMSNPKEVHVYCGLQPTVSVDCFSETVDEVLSQANALTQYPKWVRMDYVKRIRNLNCAEMVREMIITGIPTVEIARKVQAMGELTNYKVETVGHQLSHYKATIPSFLKAARQQPKKYLEVKADVEKSINVLDRMVHLYEQIQERIELGMKVDRGIGIVTPNLEKSFAVALGILQGIQDLKEKLGIGPGQEKLALPTEAAQTVDWNRVYGRESVVKVMADPDARARVLRVAERMIDLYAEKINPQSNQ